MTIDDIKQNLLDQGLNPDDYNIEISNTTIIVYPKTDRQKVVELQKENTLLKAQVQANADRADFQEELIVELAMIVYP